ncbi:uncharacterized protein LOC144102139 [Amblyomma americanum]
MGPPGVALCLLGAMSVASAYTVLEAAQVVEGKCLHEGKKMDHGAIVRSSDPCEEYRCDADKKMILFALCHYGRYQKAPPGCVLQKRSGNFPDCCPWPDCNATTQVEDSSRANLTSTEELLPLREDVAVPASEHDDGGASESSSSEAPARDSGAAVVAPARDSSRAAINVAPSA